MRRQLESMKRARDQMKDMSEKLQETYSSRSKDWIASQNGINYMDRIKQLKRSISFQQDSIDALEEYLGD